ncbi:MAG: hypothetical protein AB7Y46_02950 [Armatimonadota bacterium]
MQRYQYEIEFGTSFIQGAGAGLAGMADDMSVTADGIPFVQGDGVAHEVRRNVRQMWSGQRNLLCEGQEASPIDPDRFCDGSVDGHCLYCRMFGRRKDLPRRWDFGDAHLPDGTERLIRKALRDGLASERSVFLRHARTEMDPKRRRAKERKLFAIARAIPLDTFFGTVTYNGPGEPENDEIKAIRLGLQLIRGLGRGKRRGVGQVKRAALSEQKPSTVCLDRLTEAAGNCSAPEPRRVTITLSSEVGFPSRPERGNEYDTLPYIPGRAIWGALAGMMGLKPDTPASEAEMHLLHEDIRVHNAYPLVGGLLALPMPLSARRRKDLALPGDENPWGAESERIVDWLCTGRPEDSDDPWVPLSQPFVVVSDKDDVRPHRPRVVWRGHNTPRAPRADSSSEGDGAAFYATEVLEAGQQFDGWIECTNERSAGLFEELMTRVETWCALRLKGREHKAEVMPIDATWSEYHAPTDATDGDQARLTLTLLSPALITDEWGRTPSLLSAKWLADHLGVPPQAVTLQRHYSALVPVLGESGAWGLPLAAETAVAAGSAFLYQIADPPDDWSERLGTLSRLGIGRRRAEGFGQVVVNWKFHTICAPAGGES